MLLAGSGGTEMDMEVATWGSGISVEHLGVGSFEQHVKHNKSKKVVSMFSSIEARGFRDLGFRLPN